MLHILVLSNISIETIVLGVVVLLCITTFGINVFLRQQIITQKQAHEIRIQQLQVQIVVQKKISKHNRVVELVCFKSQKAFYYKVDTLKIKCLHLYQLTRQLNI